MTPPTLIDFPFPNVDNIIALVDCEPASFFLDSSLKPHPGSLYSYAGIKLSQIVTGSNNPWPSLEAITKDFSKTKNAPFFSGGLVGYLSYETARHNFPWFKPQQGPLPDYWFGFYDSVLVIDHQENRAFLASSFLSEDDLKKKRKEWEDLFHGSTLPLRSNGSMKSSSSEARPFRVRAPCPSEKSQIISMPDKKNYASKLKTIKNYLEAGDAYQINYTERFEANTPLSSGELYKRLRKTSPVPYGAFLNGGDFQVLSASPELFFETENNQIVTRPIKGTCPRSPDPAIDASNARFLLDSIKDRAELLMITDLERNDLGRICQTGSVKVNTLFEVESFAQVHHLVSTVSGRLKDRVTLPEIFKALFPGGSITGAPKIRAMQIIAELEEKPRSVYTGALGFMGLGCAQFNMPIRTLTKTGSKIYFHAGGGIVMDSQPEKEFEELMVKAKGIMEALGD